MRILKYSPIDKEFLKGTFDVEFPDWDLTIRRMKYFVKNNTSWISFPSEMYEKDGEKKYFPFVVFGQNTDKKNKEAIVHKVKEFVNRNPSTQEKKSSWDNLVDQEIQF